MKQSIIILILLSQLEIIFAQRIPRGNFLYQSKKIFYDAGIDWASLTVFSPLRYELKKQDGIKITNSRIYLDGVINYNIGKNSYLLSYY